MRVFAHKLLVLTATNLISAFSLYFIKLGTAMDARMPVMATTIMTSIKVNPAVLVFRLSADLKLKNFKELWTCFDGLDIYRMH